jgi:hypothetical protein
MAAGLASSVEPVMALTVAFRSHGVDRVRHGLQPTHSYHTRLAKTNVDIYQWTTLRAYVITLTDRAHCAYQHLFTLRLASGWRELTSGACGPRRSPHSLGDPSRICRAQRLPRCNGKEVVFCLPCCVLRSHFGRGPREREGYLGVPA